MKTILNKQFLKSEILHIILLFILFLIGGYLLYQNQHQQIETLTGKNTSLSSTNKSQSSKITAL